MKRSVIRAGALLLLGLALPASVGAASQMAAPLLCTYQDNQGCYHEVWFDGPSGSSGYATTSSHVMTCYGERVELGGGGLYGGCQGTVYYVP